MAVLVHDNNVEAVGIGSCRNDNEIIYSLGCGCRLIFGNFDDLVGFCHGSGGSEGDVLVINCEATAHLLVVAAFETDGNEVVGVGIGGCTLDGNLYDSTKVMKSNTGTVCGIACHGEHPVRETVRLVSLHCRQGDVCGIFIDGCRIDDFVRSAENTVECEGDPCSVGCKAGESVGSGAVNRDLVSVGPIDLAYACFRLAKIGLCFGADTNLDNGLGLGNTDFGSRELLAATCQQHHCCK